MHSVCRAQCDTVDTLFLYNYLLTCTPCWFYPMKSVICNIILSTNFNFLNRILSAKKCSIFFYEKLHQIVKKIRLSQQTVPCCKELSLIILSSKTIFHSVYRYSTVRCYIIFFQIFSREFNIQNWSKMNLFQY